MALPEGYLPRDGDVLVVLATVSFTVDPGDERVHVKLASYWQNVTLNLADIVAVYARHYEVGDRVRNTNDHDDVGGVIGIDADMVWVRLDSGARATFIANDLEPEPKLAFALAPEIKVGDVVTQEGRPDHVVRGMVAPAPHITKPVEPLADED